MRRMVLALVLMGTPLLASAQGRSDDAAKGSAKNARTAKPSKVAKAHPQGSVAWTVTDFYDKARGLPHGLKQRDHLPPGLQKQLQRNGTLPPGLAKRMTPLPCDLIGRLPVLPTSQERGLIGDRVITIDRSSQRILEVIDLAMSLGK